MSEKAESPLGRLNLNGQISDAEYEAGIRYAVVVGEYRSVIEVPRSTSGSGNGRDFCEGGCGTLIELFGTDKVKCSCLERKLRYDAAFAAVLGARPGFTIEEIQDPRRRALALAVARAQALRVAPLPKQDQRAARAVARVAVHREDLAREDFVHLVRGLRALARHFGLTGRRRREHS